MARLGSGIKSAQQETIKRRFMRNTILLLMFSLMFSSNVFADVYIGGKKKLLPLGDSLTSGTGDSTGNIMGYRDHLQDLIGGEYEIVGTILDPYTATGYSTAHDGLPSINTSDTEDRTQFALDRMLTNNTPSGSGILLWIGTNDAARKEDSVSGYSNAGTVANIEDILDIIRTHNTELVAYVANLGKNGDAGNEGEMVEINGLLETMIGTYRSTYPNFTVVLVDMHTMSENDTWDMCSGDFLTNCLNDVTHFNDTGYQSVARQWQECIEDNDGTNCD